MLDDSLRPPAPGNARQGHLHHQSWQSHRIRARRKDIAMVLDFAREHGLAVLADEVYQEDIYLPGDRFVSFARVLEARGIRDVTLFSFHSCSKGLLAEAACAAAIRIPQCAPDVAAQILKLLSVCLCSNLADRWPPMPWFTLQDQEIPLTTLQSREEGHLEELKLRAALLVEGLNKIDGVSCNAIAGAMYAFPRIMLPVGVSDEEYCMALLEETGICVVPGSGFGQAEGTAHFRTNHPPATEKIRQVVEKLSAFHESYVLVKY